MSFRSHKREGALHLLDPSVWIAHSHRLNFGAVSSMRCLTLEDCPSKFLRGIEEVLTKVVKKPAAFKAKPSDKQEHIAMLEQKLSISNGGYAAGSNLCE